MPKRSNPWPAFVDLFSCLLIGTFAGFVLLSAANSQKGKEVATLKAQIAQVGALRAEVERISNELNHVLKENSTLQSVVRKCGEDTCIDVSAHFDTNGAKITDEGETSSIRSACSVLRQSIQDLGSERRDLVNIVIEGHADDTQMSTEADGRTRFLYNWELSARRAAAMLYEFSECGMKPPAFHIVAIGYADSDPLCTEQTKECRARNRRTTLRLRVNSEKIVPAATD